MSLRLLDQTCSIARRSVSTPLADSVPLHLVLADVDAFLAQIYLQSTKLALTRDPTSIRDHVSSLVHATRLVRDDIHGATLAKHVRNTVLDIIDALHALTRSVLNDDQDHVLRTAALHDLITAARSSSGIPKDNPSAVYLAWRSNGDALKDNLDEIARIIDGTQSDPDDGWDEIGLEGTANLDGDELARAKTVHQVLRLATLFHDRILLDLLSYPSSAPLSAYDDILSQSDRLLPTADDIVAALYTPQDPDHVRDQVSQLKNIITCLHMQSSLFLPTTDQLADQLRTITLATAPPSKKRADKKWFDTCVDRTLSLCSSLSSPGTDLGS